MKQGIEYDKQAWITLFDKEYKDNQYLYHYTDILKAIKILNTDSLKFSKLCKTNDTIEAKPKIKLDENVECDNKRKSKIMDYFFKTNTSYIQLLCFTDDQPRRNESHVNEVKMYSDFSGRGFSLPRMWAQYAEKNTGVCLMFNRFKLNQIINELLEDYILERGSVTYINQFQEYPLESKTINYILSDAELHNSDIETTVRNQKFFERHKDFIKYNYLYKLDDWAGEREFRYIAYGDNDFFVNGISEALSGVIIGEKIEPEFEKIVTVFCQNICEVKKISFTCNGCNISNVHSD